MVVPRGKHVGPSTVASATSKASCRPGLSMSPGLAHLGVVIKVTPDEFDPEAPGSAGADSTHSDVAPVDGLRRDAFTVLQRALRELLREEGGPPTASGLRLRMGALTHGGFKLKALGYSRFRDLLADAEAQDLIVLDSARQGDVAVKLPEKVAGDKGTPYLRSDLWKAIVDWNPRTARVWDRETERALMLPREPVLLEPERFARIRELMSSEPDRFISIPHLTVLDQLQLLKGLAAQSDLGLGTRFALDGAFNSTRPMKSALEILKADNLDFATAWTNLLRGEALTIAEKWKADTPALADVNLFPTSPVPPVKEMPHAHASSRTDTSAVKSPVPQADLGGYVLGPYMTESDLRSLIHRAIDRMSSHELHALAIPLGYLLPEK